MSNCIGKHYIACTQIVDLYHSQWFMGWFTHYVLSLTFAFSSVFQTFVLYSIKRFTVTIHLVAGRLCSRFKTLCKDFLKHQWRKCCYCWALYKQEEMLNRVFYFTFNYRSLCLWNCESLLSWAIHYLPGFRGTILMSLRPGTKPDCFILDQNK